MLDEERYALIDEACGVIGIHGHPDAARLVCAGLHALQHRGQEAAGIAARSAAGMSLERRAGLVAPAFDAALLARLPGDVAIGHVRYATTGASNLRNAQPLRLHTRYGHIALAHNGNLTNAARLRAELEADGAIFSSETDTEVIAHLIARSAAPDLEGALISALALVQGAYSLVVLTDELLCAARDPRGVRPLVAGRLGSARVVASETCALQRIGAAVERELAPGELLCIRADGSERWSRPLEPAAPSPCVFELVYFARPDSEVFGQSVYAARRRMGALLAREASVQADVVVAVPESGIPAAVGYAAALGLVYEPGLVRSGYTGRTFIEPAGPTRARAVRDKLAVVRHIVEGKRVAVVDDSIVRGTTSQQIVRMIRDAGAREVHLRVASPPTTHPCFYGIDTRDRAELIAAHHTTDAICAMLGADSLAYLSLAGLREAVGASGASGFCEACFTGAYPIPTR